MMGYFTTPERRRWLESLNVGDEVACDNSRYNSRPSYRIMKITKITPTRMLITDNKERWNNDGEARSSGHLYTLVPVTEEIRSMVERDELMEKVKALKFDKMPNHVLQDILRVSNGEITAGEHTAWRAVNVAQSKGSAVLFIAVLLKRAGGKVVVTDKELVEIMDNDEFISSYYEQAECAFHLEWIKGKPEFVNEECGRIDPQ